MNEGAGVNAPEPLVPPEARARAKRLGRFAFGFGPRFFVVVLFGLLWLVPAWWVPRLIVGMLLWDLVAVAMFVVDLLRLPKPSQVEGCRTWGRAISLAAVSEVAISIRNLGGIAIRSYLVDETPSSLRITPPMLELVASAGEQALARYQILPRRRGDIHVGQLFLRYQSRLGFAERWAAADLSQTVRVFPHLEEA